MDSASDDYNPPTEIDEEYIEQIDEQEAGRKRRHSRKTRSTRKRINHGRKSRGGRRHRKTKRRHRH
jgi:hypothetical protein